MKIVNAIILLLLLSACAPARYVQGQDPNVPISFSSNLVTCNSQEKQHKDSDGKLLDTYDEITCDASLKADPALLRAYIEQKSKAYCKGKIDHHVDHYEEDIGYSLCGGGGSRQVIADISCT